MKYGINSCLSSGLSIMSVARSIWIIMSPIKKKPHHGVLRGGAREGGGISPLEAIYNIAYV